MKTEYWISYGEGTFGPYPTYEEALRITKVNGWFSFDICDNFEDALAATETDDERPFPE
jgi:hypothetical protein